jgi:hypothetical protein
MPLTFFPLLCLVFDHAAGGRGGGGRGGGRGGGGSAGAKGGGFYSGLL